MNYLPLRVRSVFSRGRGATVPAELALYLHRQGLSRLPVCDPESLLAWEYFREEAEKHGLDFMPGLEVSAGRQGEMLVFPCRDQGLPVLLELHNGLAPDDLHDCTVVFLPALQDYDFIDRLRARVAPGRLYLGLTWNSRRWLVTAAQNLELPLVWANPWCWQGDSSRYRVICSVFRHLPWPEAARMELSFEGPIPASAVVRRWGRAGREALENTLRLARSLHFSFNPGTQGRNAGEQELIALVGQKLNQCRAGEAERSRAARELQVINGLAAAHAFLIAADLASFCRSADIYFNLRGSSAASFVLHLLGLSRCNPLRHGLMSERFLSSLRGDLPDIDIDIEAGRREEVLAWVADRYRGRTAFISSHKFFGGRSALYDTARVFGYSAAEAQDLAKKVPMFSRPADLLEASNCAPAEILRAAARLDGVFRELSLHVGGVIFTPGSANRDFPLDNAPEGFCQTVWDRRTVERMRLFKIDLLSLRGFSVIAQQALHGKPRQGHETTWRNIRDAATVGCFQLESPLARENLLAARPADLVDLAACLAVIRPGPARAGMKKAYLERRSPAHPLLGRLFPHTRGTLLYEEQVSLLLHETSGWSLEQCEETRRRLRRGASPALAGDYLKAGLARGWRADELQLFWRLAADFSLYAFCQAHSVALAYSAYLSAWLKSNDPLTFFCRLFNAGGGYYPLPVYIEEARRWGLQVLPPDVCRSQAWFQVESGALRTGLCFIRGVGQKTARRIIETRRNGFSDLMDFMRRTRCSEKEVSLLLSAAALDEISAVDIPRPEKEKKWQAALGFQPGESLAPSAADREKAPLPAAACKKSRFSLSLSDEA